MDDSMDREIGDLLDAMDKRREADTRRKAEAERERNRFPDAFMRVRDEVIRPVLESAGEALRRRGHDYRVEDDPSQPEDHMRRARAEDGTPEPRPTVPAIRLSLVLHWHQLDMSPHASDYLGIEFRAATRAQKVEVRASTGSGPKHTLTTDLNEVTPELVKRQTIEVLRAITERLR